MRQWTGSLLVQIMAWTNTDFMSTGSLVTHLSVKFESICKNCISNICTGRGCICVYVILLSVHVARGFLYLIIYSMYKKQRHLCDPFGYDQLEAQLYFHTVCFTVVNLALLAPLRQPLLNLFGGTYVLLSLEGDSCTDTRLFHLCSKYHLMPTTKIYKSMQV